MMKISLRALLAEVTEDEENEGRVTYVCERTEGE